jgi:arabinose-5-phosphate isomerase
MDNNALIALGKRVVRVEGGAVAELEGKINGSFADAVHLIAGLEGRVIITGVGKSGIIARKIVATFNSTGTPAVFLHPTDAVHGDLGILRKGDAVICISKSGNTPEINTLVPLFKGMEVPIVSILGNPHSYLAEQSTVTLDASVKEEACPHDLAPTSSTTVALVLGDALAIGLLETRDFSREDFAMFHPGGTLGKRLLLKVDELMITGKEVPSVRAHVPLRDAIYEMTTKRLGCTCVTKDDGTLEGMITDGDLRRLLQKTSDISGMTAGMVMTHTPKTARLGTLAVVVLQEMESHKITQVIVVDQSHAVRGVVHLHDLVKAGLGGDDGG